MTEGVAPGAGARDGGGGFGDRLAAAVASTGPLCAGIDPSAELLAAWGLPGDAAGLSVFASRCIEAFAGHVAAVKPQVAFFERLGSKGIAVLERFIAEARSAGLLVIADAKRGDIGSTSSAYASAWLDPASPLASDAVTAVPYMGLGSLRPMVDLALAHGNGVIVVVRSSNPEGRAIQEAVTATGRSVQDELLAAVADLNHPALAGAGVAEGGRGSVGVVVGATLAPSAFPLAELGGPILAPGVGAQGATAADVAALFGGCPPGSVLPSVSRSVLAAGPSVESLRSAALRELDAMAAALGRGAPGGGS